MAELSLFSLVLTLGTYQIGLWCQKKLKTPLCNPVLIAVVLVISTLLVTGIPVETYQSGTTIISWLLTPATICLALPLYEQLKQLKDHLGAIWAGVVAGTLTSLAVVFGMCRLFALDRQLTVSVLPKSITTAMGVVLSGQNGGIEALSATVIIVTGILGSLFGSLLCKLLRLDHPIAQGVALGTASHVIGTSRANELSPLTGAVSSLSLAIAGILTAILFPFVCMLL